jgi:hypothetical protein
LPALLGLLVPRGLVPLPALPGQEQRSVPRGLASLPVQEQRSEPLGPRALPVLPHSAPRLVLAVLPQV